MIDIRIPPRSGCEYVITVLKTNGRIVDVFEIPVKSNTGDTGIVEKTTALESGDFFTRIRYNLTSHFVPHGNRQ